MSSMEQRAFELVESTDLTIEKVIVIVATEFGVSFDEALEEVWPW